MDARTRAFIDFLKRDESGELEFRNYSGRGMFGEQCLGITGNIGSIISNLVSLAFEQGGEMSDTDKMHIVTGLSRGVSVDSMGLSSIVYFPGVRFTSQDEREMDDGASEEEDESTVEDGDDEG